MPSSHRTARAKAPRRAGFTLAELMVVVAILGLLAALVVPDVLGHFETAQVKRAQADLATLRRAVDQYALQHAGTLPESIADLVAPGPDGGRPLLDAPRPPEDPWGRPYGYDRTPEAPGFRLWSLGRDGAPGGEGPDADLDSAGSR